MNKEIYNRLLRLEAKGTILSEPPDPLSASLWEFAEEIRNADENTRQEMADQMEIAVEALLSIAQSIEPSKARKRKLNGCENR